MLIVDNVVMINDLFKGQHDVAPALSADRTGTSGEVCRVEYNPSELLPPPFLKETKQQQQQKQINNSNEIK